MTFSLEALGKAEVQTSAGETIALSETWKSQNTVLVFIRHFG